uniref:Bile salt export pump n=1 Tax=Chromera velia CCMP2878 TaxID=1169474 RepID=A0A0G4H968_9ALVE|eukprot:Cvel_25315.t1-p1 / transcript=Cvel_25315.t1 / gene=Cvel_25315 / organism=Chromera_velia_CCMP2878 / gene_product=Leptomycin B resistance protein pmd1, putative / transcript_product=Leptomycin B resistance protein pmd1, putative / location=Cvel_scaffold2850:5598-15976(-) / protein_length=1438 / sequence_SO=supercontig / SO=protein_coding / is_pseudo=false
MAQLQPQVASPPVTAEAPLDLEAPADEQQVAMIDKKEKEKAAPRVGVLKVYRFASKLDVFLIFIGLCAAAGQGASLLTTPQPLLSSSAALWNSFPLSPFLMQPLFTLLLGELVEELGNPNSDMNFWPLIQWMIIIAAATGVCNYVSAATFESTAERQVKALRRTFYKAAIRQEQGWYDQHNASELSTRLTEDSLAFRTAIGSKLSQGFGFFSMFIAGFVVGIVVNWELALVVCAALPLLMIAGAYMVKALAGMQEESSAAYAEAGGVAEEAIQNIRTVASFGGEGRTRQKFADKLGAAEKAGIKGALQAGLAFGALFGIMFGAYGLGFWYGGKLIADSEEDARNRFRDATPPPNDDVPACFMYPDAGCVNVGDVLTVFFSVLMASFALGQMAPSISTFVEGMTAAYRLFELIDRKSQIDPFDEKGLKPQNVEGTVELRNVKFAFPARKEKPVFNQLSLTVEAGKTVAFVGASGSGKSTTISLVERFYDPDEGVVLLDGKDLRDLNLQWLRENIGLVTQEPRLFSATIFENIANGKPGCTREEVEQAAKNANAHNFICGFPDGYDTYVGDGGSQLSGGQKQRIAIARAMIRDPPILLLDEATSALDNESERIVQEALDRLLQMKKRTTIVIAHRLTTIRNADKIVVFDNADGNGSIVAEQGTHSELMAKKEGLYHKLAAVHEAMANADQAALVRYISGQGGETEKNLDKALSMEKLASLMGDTEKEGETPGGRTERANSLDKLVKKYSNEALENPGGLMLAEVEPQGEREKSEVQQAWVTESPDAAGRLARGEYGEGEGEEEKLEGEGEGGEKEEEEKGCLCFKKKKEDPNQIKNVVGRLYGLVKDQTCYLLWGVFAAACAGSVFPIFSIIFSEMIEAFFAPTPGEIREKSNFWALMFLVLGCGQFLTNFGQFFLLGVFGHRLIRRVRETMFCCLIRQEVPYFDDPNNSPGSLTSALSEKTAYMKGIVGDNLGVFASNVVALCVGIGIAFSTNWELALVTVGSLLLIIPAGAIEMSVMTETADKSAVKEEGHIVSESLTSIRIVTAFGLENRMLDWFEVTLQAKLKKGLCKAQTKGLALAFSQVAQFGTYAFAFWYGSYMIEQDRINVSDMLKTIFALVMAGAAAGQNFVFAIDKKKADDAAQYIFKLVDRVPKVDVTSDEEGVKPSVDQTVRLEDARFFYQHRADVQIFGGVSVTIPPGKTTALVGASGCGKSTVIQLMERFYELDSSVKSSKKGIDISGRLLLGETDITEVNCKALRACIGLVSQEPVLFRGTIKENIAYGKVEGQTATDAEVEEAARMANAHEFISRFPKGYDTDVGGKGSQLSGGQKQRIAIARAMIRDPPILLLDEATSALDNESERIVQEALDRLLQMKKRTTIVIAHRLSTIRNADKIVVFDNPDRTGSRVVEEGNHDELMAKKGGLYRQLVEIASANPASS